MRPATTVPRITVTQMATQSRQWNGSKRLQYSAFRLVALSRPWNVIEWTGDV